MRVLLAALCLIFAACSGDGGRHIGDSAVARIVVMPADSTVTVTDGVPVLQPYTAHEIAADGTDTDVTAQTAFNLDIQYGTFSAATARISGQGAGPTRVVAQFNGIQGDTGLTVYVKSSVIGPGAPPNAGDLFGNAIEDPSLAPVLVYPSDHILVPPNLGQFDVHWNNNAASSDDLFEVKMSNEYVDVRLYTTGLDQPNPTAFWTVFAPEVWYPIASTKQTLALDLSGLAIASPATKGSVAAQSVDVTNESARGGIYYWSTSSQAIYRYDVSTPNVPPAPFFPPGMEPSSCVGCHSLSRDGTKIAMTLNGATSGVAAVYDVATRVATPVAANGYSGFDFSAFNSDATKMFTIDAGVLNLRTLDGTLLGGPFAPMTAGTSVTHPEVSPDNTKLVTVEYSGGADYYVSTGTIVIWDYDDATNTIANPRVLVASDAANGVQNYYPSFSPDGQWIAFTRDNGYSYNNPSAEIWVIKADGTGAPVQLLTSDTATGSLTNSWARWVPFGQTFGASDTPMFYLTFSSQRPFGVRIPGGGRPQIWMTPFFPDKAGAGTDPSGNAFRVPFQEVSSSNHIAQWTNAVVIQ
ncbi:MAG: hypothetical protein ABI591_06485 [Kofleriaceae bacterium]